MGRRARSGDERPDAGPGAGDETSGGGIPLFPETDQEVTDAVRAAFFLDPELPEDRFIVETVQRCVYLKGYARSVAEKQRAVSIAAGVQGVERVVDETQVTRRI